MINLQQKDWDLWSLSYLAEREIEDSPFTKEQIELCLAMSDYSEETYCASWISGNEYDLWKKIHEPVVTDEDLLKVKSLHESTNSWWTWEENGMRCLSTEEWLVRLNQDSISLKKSYQ
jgi:hypothetical protein